MRLFIAAFCASILVSTPAFAASQFFPHFADGAGWKTSLIAINRGQVTATAHVFFFADDGRRLTVPVVGVPVSPNYLAVLVPFETATLETIGNGSALTSGWIQIDTDDDISFTAIVRQRVAGRPDNEAAAFSRTPSPHLIAPFDNRSGFNTAIALTNPNGALPLNLTLIFRDESGKVITASSFLLDARNHTAFSMVDRFPVLAGKLGSIEITGSTATGQLLGFIALGLRFNSEGSFTSLPY